MAASPSSSAPAGDWHGVAAEGQDQISATMASFLRGRSKKLLFSLLRPHMRAVVGSVATIMVYNLCALAGPWLVKVAIDTGIPIVARNGSLTPLLLIVGAYVATAVLAGLSDYEFTKVTGRIGQDVLFELRARVFDHFQKLSVGFHEKYTSGRVISRLTSDIDAIGELLAYGLTTLSWSVLFLVGITVLMLMLDVPLAVVALASLPFVLVLTVWFRSNSSRAYRATREAVTAVIVQFVETLGGMRAVQAFRREPRNEVIFGELNERYADANIWSSRLGAIYGPGVRMLGNATAAAVLLVGGGRVLDGEIKIGVLVAFLLYLKQFFEPVQELSQFYSVFQSAAAALEKLSGVLDERPTVVEPESPVPLERARGEVVFENVSFGYRDDTVVLPHVNLRIPAGQTVALVGKTGAGKTTIARLMGRFYDPTGGRVTLDGIDLRDLSEDDRRAALVTVTQEGFLFSGSVADNIGLSRPSAARVHIEAAARAIGADTFIRALPQGYDTQVAKRGGRLSSGQRQLVAFARAFLADPRVLILDEATSSLDLPTERLVQEALRTLLADRTAVIIAHRLSTVEIADRVLVIDGGRIVADGSPAEVLPTVRAG